MFGAFNQPNRGYTSPHDLPVGLFTGWVGYYARGWKLHPRVLALSTFHQTSIKSTQLFPDWWEILMCPCGNTRLDCFDHKLIQWTHFSYDDGL